MSVTALVNSVSLANWTGADKLETSHKVIIWCSQKFPAPTTTQSHVIVARIFPSGLKYTLHPGRVLFWTSTRFDISHKVVTSSLPQEANLFSSGLNVTLYTSAVFKDKLVENPLSPSSEVFHKTITPSSLPEARTAPSVLRLILLIPEE